MTFQKRHGMLIAAIAMYCFVMAVFIRAQETGLLTVVLATLLFFLATYFVLVYFLHTRKHFH